MARDAIEKDVIKAFLGEDTEFNGHLNFEGTVRIDGVFEGDILTNDNLIVGEKARIKAELKVGTIMIQGRVEGNIIASRKVQITSKGQIVGNISAPALQIEDGAVVEGQITMVKRDEAKVRPLIRKAVNESVESSAAVEK
ncbi:MAG: polymer-forming cytoskeletal protein [Nitrospinae bacterium]|nr:polymer-forming cytoskeletal protein [Nitrospinota bacterium]